MRKKCFLICTIVLFICIAANNFADVNNIDVSFRKIYNNSYAYPEGLSGGQTMVLNVSDIMSMPDTAQKDAAMAPAAKRYGYLDLAKRSNSSARQTLYNDMLKEAKDIHSAAFDIESVEVGDRTCCILQKYDLNELQLTDKEAVEVWVAFRNDYPEFYWLSNECITASDGMFCMTVYEEYANAEVRKKCTSVIETAVAEYISLANKCNTKLEMALTVHDELCKNIVYALDNGVPSSSAYAHNLMGAFENKSAVCEGYAKAYQYILNELGIENVYVTGTAVSSGSSESHAWNLVRLDDGRWYNIDVTWDDTSVNNKVVHYYFGMAKDAFAKTHTANTPSSEDPLYFLYDIPTDSDMACSLVTLYKNGVKSGVCYSIENAFANMTDITAEYTIELFENTQVFAIGNKTPSVKALHIKGHYNSTTGNCDKIYVVADNLDIGSNIIFENTAITYDSSVKNVDYINANDKTITFSGEKAQCDIDIKGNDSCVLEILASKKSVLKNADVKNVVLASKNVEFGALGCSAENIVIKDGTKDIETKMLSQFSAVKSIKIPSSVTFVSSGAFDNNLLLESIKVDDNNTSYKSVDGILYGTSQNKIKLVRCPANKRCNRLDIYNVVEIENNAFRSVNNIKTVSIRYGCSFIGEYSFAYIDSSIDIYLPSSIKNIAQNAFDESKNITIHCTSDSEAAKIQTVAKQIINEYTYTFKDYDGRVICSVTDYENSVVLKPEDPKRTSDSVYEYKFREWDNDYADGMLLTEDCEFTAQYDSTLRKYTVKFLDADGKEFSSYIADAGSAVVLPQTLPTKKSTERFEYIFARWDGYEQDESNEMKVLADITFKPVFDEKTRLYKYTFLDDDEETVISEGTLPYDETIPLPSDPVKNHFDFKRWTGYTNNITIKNDITFVAYYEPHIYKYVFYDDDGKSVISQGELPYASVIPLPDDPKEKVGQDGKTYVFSKWTGYEFGMQISEDVSFTAEYKANAFKYRFLDYDGKTVIEEGTLEQGETIPLPKSNPIRQSTKQYNYKFKSWQGYTDGMQISKNIDFVATYDEFLQEYEYIFKDEKGNTLKRAKVPYGTVIVAPSYSVSDEPGYMCEFIGWKNYTEGMIIESNRIFYAEVKKTPLFCKVTFKNYDGTVFATDSIATGSVVILPASQPKKNGYRFVGWDGYTQGMTASEDMEFVAKFELSEQSILSENYKIDDGIIYGVEQKTTFAEFKKNLKNEFEVKLYDKNGNEINDGATIVATLATVKLCSDKGEVLHELTVAVKGDINGDGKVTITDFVKIKSQLISGNAIFNKAQLQAADVSGDGKISITDFVQIKTLCLNN